MGRAGLVCGSRGRLSLVPRLSLALSVRRVRRTAASAPGLPPLRLAAAGVGDGLGPGASLQRSAQGLAARAFVLPRAVDVCVSRSESSARSAAPRGGWRRRRRPGIRLAAAPRVRAALSCSAAACLIARVLSDRVPRPCSIAELRPLEVPPEIPSLRRSDYAMITACAFTARRAIGKIELGAGPVSGAVLSTRRARRTAPSNRNDLWFEC